MLTAVGRAAARRIQAPSAHPAAAAQLLLRQAPVAFVLPIRAFSASPAAAAAASDKKATKPKTKAATKKPAAKKPDAKKPSPKPAAKKQTKKPAAKPKRVKKPLDPEEKKKANVRELKRWALRDTPALLPISKWTQFITENKDILGGPNRLGPQMAGLSSRFQSLSASELDALEDKAAANREKNAANLKAFIKSHEPARIHIANSARRRLNTLTDKTYRYFEDDRVPKKPINAYTRFSSQNWSLAEATDTVEKAKEFGQKWKAMSPSEKAIYEEQAAHDMAKYTAEMEVVRARAEVIKAENNPKGKK